MRNQRAEGTGCRHRRPGGLRLFTEDKARRSSIEKAEWGFVVSFLLSFSAGLCWLSHRPLPRPLPAALNACLKCSGAWIFSAAGFPAGGFPGGRRCLPLRGKVRRPQATIKMLDFLSFHVASIVLFIPPILRLATASHVRRPQMCSRPKYPIKNTGGSAIRVMGISGFRVPMFSGFGLTGGGLWVAGLKWVGSVVLFPPRAILPQGEESDGSLRRCLALPGKGRCRCARSTLFALRAKALQSGAPYFGVSRKKQGFGAFCPSGNSPRRAGERASPRKGRSLSHTPSAPRSPNEPFPARNGDTPHLTDETNPLLLQNLPLYPSAANAALYKPRLIAPAFCGEHRARAQAQLSAPAKGYLSTLPATSSPVIPPPQTPQADGPCSWAVRRVCALPPEQKRNETSPPPCSWGGLA